MKNHREIGILGGSFNPAHEGHLYISKQAYTLLKFDAVWWVIALQNPLKSKKDILSFEDRINSAQKISSTDKKIYVSDFEKRHKTQYSFDTLSKLKKTFPENNFTWLMGEDNLLQFKLWYKWEEILKSFKIAVFPRLENKSDLEKKAIIGYKEYEYKGLTQDFYKSLPPNIIFLDIEKKNISSTIIRKNYKI